MEPTRLHWIKDEGDDPADVCAHSPVRLVISEHSLVTPDDGDWTVSASAVVLLRTLSRDHTKQHPAGEHLFPCCGDCIDVGEDDVVICGCPSGKDFEITHGPGSVALRADGQTHTVSEADWRDAVFSFCDEVMAFYERSSPKTPSDAEDRKGFDRMMSEWRHRRAEPCHAP